MTYHLFSSGINTSFSEQLNSNFGSLRLLGSSLTSSTANTSDLTDLASITIASSLSKYINSGILIKLLVTATTSGAGDTQLAYEYAYGSINISAGLAGSEVSLVDLTPIALQTYGDGSSSTDHHSGSTTSILEYFYVPTASEKSNGFNVLIKGKWVRVNSWVNVFTASVTLHQALVYGVL